jgi:hypothetical protein
MAKPRNPARPAAKPRSRTSSRAVTTIELNPVTSEEQDEPAPAQERTQIVDVSKAMGWQRRDSKPRLPAKRRKTPGTP